MATYQIIYWHEFPAQVTARDEDGQVSGVLPERFQQAIDAAAMAAGLAGEEAYLEGWMLGPEQARDGRAQETLAAVLAELNAVYPPRRLAAMVQARRDG